MTGQDGLGIYRRVIKKTIGPFGPRPSAGSLRDGGLRVLAQVGDNLLQTLVQAAISEMSVFKFVINPIRKGCFRHHIKSTERRKSTSKYLIINNLRICNIQPKRYG